MSCYRPLISRWTRDDQHQKYKSRHVSDTRHHGKQSQSEFEHVQAITDRKGGELTQDLKHFPNQVIFNNRLGDSPSEVKCEILSDIETRAQPRGVLSLGLPLGISSLKLGSRRRRKQKRHYNENNGHQSDGEVMNQSRRKFWYQQLNKSSHTINDEVDLIDFDNRTASSFQNANTPSTKTNHHAERKRSLPRKSKIASGYDDPLQRPRCVSVDADQLIQSSARDKTCMSRDSRASTSKEEILKYAGLTSPSQYMMSHKSSSGNSSASDVTPDTDSASECAQWVCRGRTPVSLVTTQAPPPRHLLPTKLKPSPGVKCHPIVILPHHLQRGIEKFASMFVFLLNNLRFIQWLVNFLHSIFGTSSVFLIGLTVFRNLLFSQYWYPSMFRV